MPDKCVSHSYSADLCPDTGKPCVEFCDPAKGDQCARTNQQISTMTEAQKAAYWFDLYLEETCERRKLERELASVREELGLTMGTLESRERNIEDLMRQHGPSERLIIALESCSSKLAQLGREFSSVNFTDRHGDGPVCLALAKHARTVLDEVRLAATTGGNK